MSSDAGPRIWKFHGGRVCLDFANTLDWRLAAVPEELLGDFSALLSWSEARGTLAPAAIERLARKARRDSRRAGEIVSDARWLREMLWQAIDAARSGTVVRTQTFSRFLEKLPAQPPVQKLGEHYQFAIDGESLEQPLWPVLWSWTAVLTSPDIDRLGCCEAQGCGWYYVDESPNNSRRWCSSEACGNRERVRRAYLKKRQGKPTGD